MSDACSIRPARADDVPLIEACASAAYHKYIDRIGRAPAPMLADFAAQTAQGRVHVMMAGGKLVGFAVCYHDREGYFLENIAIGPACQDLGYGAQLLNYVEQLAIGACTIRLNTNEKMTENLAWYQHRGFVETARRVEDGFARVYFEKKL